MEITYENEIMTAFLKGEIDHHTAAPIRSEIDGKAESMRPHVLRLDFSGVKFMDSSGIGLIMGRYRQISLLGGSLEVVNIPKNLEKIISLSGVCSLGVVK